MPYAHLIYSDGLQPIKNHQTIFWPLTSKTFELQAKMAENFWLKMGGPKNPLGARKKSTRLDL